VRRDLQHPVARQRPVRVLGKNLQQIERAGEPYRETYHGYCKSIYVASPDGLVVEFTEDPPDVAEIDAAPAPMRTRNWLAGWPATAAPTTNCGVALSDPLTVFPADSNPRLYREFVARIGPKEPFARAGPMVRIRFPPAGSHVRTSVDLLP
jgi:hypothetical protein